MKALTVPIFSTTIMTALFVHGQSRAIHTCSQYQDCISTTVTQVSPECGDNGCSFKVCYTLSNGGACDKGSSETFSLACDNGVGDDPLEQCNQDSIFDTWDTIGASISGFSACQYVEAGGYAYFASKDYPECSDSFTEILAIDGVTGSSSVNYSCGPSDDLGVAGQVCSTWGRRECVFSVGPMPECEIEDSIPLDVSPEQSETPSSLPSTLPSELPELPELPDDESNLSTSLWRPIYTCSQYQDCLTTTVTQVSPECGDTGCSFKVCYTLSSGGACDKGSAGPFSLVCDNGVGDDLLEQCNQDSIFDTWGIIGEKVPSISACQYVEAGGYAYFASKDYPECSDSFVETLAIDGISGSSSVDYSCGASDDLGVAGQVCTTWGTKSCVFSVGPMPDCEIENRGTTEPSDTSSVEQSEIPSSLPSTFPVALPVDDTIPLPFQSGPIHTCSQYQDCVSQKLWGSTQCVPNVSCWNS